MLLTTEVFHVLRESQRPALGDDVRPVSSGRPSGHLERLITANSAATANPTTAATLSANAGGTVGGLLAPGVYYVNFTETNGYGETTVSAESGPITVAAQAAPSGTPTVVVSGTGGALPAGVYRGKFTYVDSNLNASGAFGETTAGTEFSFTQTAAPSRSSRSTTAACQAGPPAVIST